MQISRAAFSSPAPDCQNAQTGTRRGISVTQAMHAASVVNASIGRSISYRRLMTALRLAVLAGDAGGAVVMGFCDETAGEEDHPCAARRASGTRVRPVVHSLAVVCSE